MASLSDIQQLSTVLASMDVEMPAELADVLATWEAVNGATSRSPAHRLTEAAKSGEMTAENASSMMLEAGAAVAAHDAAAGTRNGLAAALAGRFVTHLRGSAGDDLIAALRPTFDAAVAGIDACPFGPDATATDILDLGDDAAAAWRDLPGHARVLQEIRQQVCHPFAFAFALNGARVYDQQHDAVNAWLLDGSRGADLAEAGAILGGRPDPRGGHWLRLVRAGHRLRLNTAAEAVAILDAYDAEKLRAPSPAIVDVSVPSGEASFYPRTVGA